MTDPRDPTAGWGAQVRRSVDPIAAPPDDTGFLAGIGLGYKQAETGPDSSTNDRRYRGEIYRDLAVQLREKGFGAFWMAGVRGDEQRPGMEGEAARFWGAVARARRQGLIKGHDDVYDGASLDAVASRRRTEDFARANTGAARLNGWGQAGAFIGAIGASWDDPETWAGFVIPAAAAGGSVLRQILMTGLKEAGVNAAVGLAAEPFIRADAAKIGVERTWRDTAFDVGAQAGFGAVAGAAGKGLELWADGAAAKRFRAAMPEENWTPDERAAVNVIERTDEIAAASPYERTAAGDHQHFTRMERGLRAVREGLAGDREPGPARPAPAVVPFPHMWRAILGIEGGTDAQGRFRTSPAGAVGPAQLMEATGPEAARLAGLAWDAKRMRSDAAYNEALGQAYFRKQLESFGGDPVKAAAAYNAGPGSARTGKGVRGAMARAARAGEPENWERYLPAETRAYVENFRRRTGVGDAPSAVPARADDIAPADWSPLPDEPVLPELRRDMFPDETSWRVARAADEAETLGLPPEITRGTIWAEARAALEAERGGEAPGALFHPEVGPIDVRYGVAGDAARDYAGGFGRAHIAAKHPDVPARLPQLLDEMELIERGPERAVLASPDHRAVVALTWHGEQQKWLLTAYKRESAPVDPSSWRGPNGGGTGSTRPEATPDIGDATPRGKAAAPAREAPPMPAPTPPAPDAALAGHAAARFDDPGPAIVEQAMGLTHDVQAAIDQGDMGHVPFAASGIVQRNGQAVTLPESARVILADLDAEDAAIAALKGCL